MGPGGRGGIEKANGAAYGEPSFSPRNLEMGKRYSNEAIEYCRTLYHKYGGRSHDLIEAEMHKAGWPGWRRNTLYDKGKGEHERFGWITKHGFERTLKIYVETLAERVNNDEQDLYIGIRRVRQALQKAVDAGTATKDEVYQYRDFCKLEIDARKNLDLSRDNLETFVSGFEKLVIWLEGLDPAAAKVLVKHGEKLADMAAAHYGKTEAEHDGASNRADESGDESFSLLDR